jgi:hypothetical protein
MLSDVFIPMLDDPESTGTADPVEDYLAGLSILEGVAVGDERDGGHTEGPYERQHGRPRRQTGLPSRSRWHHLDVSGPRTHTRRK